MPPVALRFESTQFYLWDRASHRRIAATLPDVRVIAVIRDSVDRAFSNWTHLRADGLEPEPDFLAACRKSPIRSGAALGSLARPTLWRRASQPLLAVLQRGARPRPRLRPEDRAGRERGAVLTVIVVVAWFAWAALIVRFALSRPARPDEPLGPEIERA